MAATETIQIPLGSTAPDFTLLDTVSGKQLSLQTLRGSKATLVMFICNHCPYVLHINQQLVQLANDYMPKGVSFIAISSNDVARYPADSPQKMHETAQLLSYPFPYLYDETQEVAKAYYAACTPDFSLFDAELTCIYRGQLDNSRPSNGLPVTGYDIRTALDALLNNQKVSDKQQASIGCSIKWKGEAPY